MDFQCLIQDLVGLLCEVIAARISKENLNDKEKREEDIKQRTTENALKIHISISIRMKWGM